MNTHVRARLVGLTFIVALLAGCSGPQAALDLIAVAREGLTGAKEVQARQHEQLMSDNEAKLAALDAAFDADVRLVEAGGITKADGEPVALSSEWVISARQGYAAARDALAEEMNMAQAAHLINEDNLQACDEALEMAGELIIQRSLLWQRIRQLLANARKETTDGR